MFKGINLNVRNARKETDYKIKNKLYIKQNI